MNRNESYSLAFNKLGVRREIPFHLSVHMFSVDYRHRDPVINLLLIFIFEKITWNYLSILLVCYPLDVSIL